MASTEGQYESDDGMDEFMDKFKTQRYKNAFTENNWEDVSSCLLATLAKKLFLLNWAVFTPVLLMML